MFEKEILDEQKKMKCGSIKKMIIRITHHSCFNFWTFTNKVKLLMSEIMDK